MRLDLQCVSRLSADLDQGRERSSDVRFISAGDEACAGQLQEMYRSGQLDLQLVRTATRWWRISANKLGMTLAPTGIPMYSWMRYGKTPENGVEAVCSTFSGWCTGQGQRRFLGKRICRSAQGYQHPEAVVKMLNLHEEVVHGSIRGEGEFITVEEAGDGIRRPPGCPFFVQSGVSNEDVAESLSLLREAIRNEELGSLLKDAHPNRQDERSFITDNRKYG